MSPVSPSTGSKVTSFVMPAAMIRPAFWRTAAWYQAAVRQKAGRIIAAGMTKEVTFEPVDGLTGDIVDDAYRAKYNHSPYLSWMLGPRAQSATVKVMPRETAARDQSMIGQSSSTSKE